jgi:class 3 adenylate cyclase
MRYIDGHDLSAVLAARGALPIALAVQILAAVAAALDAAHAKGLVHRDVKPGNVLLAGPDEAPHVYLTDFGLTKRVGEQSMTAAGQIVGSIGYIAPEQIEGRPVDARTDVYSLGCLAFDILTGAQPFRRDSEMAVLMAHVHDPPPSLLASRHELPEALDAAVAQAMAKDPGARFASAGEFAAAVTEAVHPDSGAITRGFLFADLRDYTAYVEGHGDAGGSALLDIYRRMMRDTIARHGGAEIKTEGDSFYVVFPSASSAVMCGLSIVAAAVGQAHSDPDHPIQVGVGVNAGEAVAAADGYVGSAVNIAARVCALAKPGEVLVTDTVRGLTRTSGRLTFVPVGRRTLKGIAEPVALFRAEPAAGVLATAAGGRGPIWRRRSVLAGIGGLAVLALAALVVAKGGFGPLGASPSASAGPSASQIAASPSVLIGELPNEGTVVPPGTYAIHHFPGVASVTISEEVDQSQWKVAADNEGLLYFEKPIPPGRAGVGLARILVVWTGGCFSDPTRTIGDRPQDLINWVQSAPQFDASEPYAVTDLGLIGIGIEATVLGAPAGSLCEGNEVWLWGVGGGYWNPREGTRIVFEALDDGSRTLTVVFVATNAAELQSAKAASRDLLESMVLQN